jgi:hypothetical protein
MLPAPDEGVLPVCTILTGFSFFRQDQQDEQDKKDGFAVGNPVDPV